MQGKKFIYFIISLMLIIYGVTVSHTIPWGDGAEFYVAIKNLGIPHPSGYPLFLLLGRFFYLLFSGPYIINFLPGIFTVFGLFFLFFSIFRLTKSPWLGLALTLGFGLCQEVWRQSVTAEVYSLNLTFMFILLFLLLNIRDNRTLFLGFFVAGLALTNHLTSVFYIVPLFFLFKKSNMKLRYGILFFVFPLLLYLYFPIRTRFNPLPNLFHPAHFSSLVQYISGQPFQYRTLFFEKNYFFKELSNFIKLWWNQFFILIPIGFYGIVKLKQGRLRYAIIIGLLLILFYTIFYNIPDKDGYYLPIFGLWLILIAIGLSKLLPRLYHPLLFIFPVFNFIINYQVCNYSREQSLYDLSRTIYNSLPEHSILISDDYYFYFTTLNLETERKKNIIPVSQFYLRMDWYLEDLQKNYSIRVPERARQLINECNQRLRTANRTQYGELSKKYCHLVQQELIRANIDRIPIFIFLYDDANWPKRWLDFYLDYYGLYYRFCTDLPRPWVYPLDLPSPQYYRVGELKHPDAITVAKKFAAAYNRRAIYRFQLGELSGAVKDFQRALEYFPQYYQVYSNLGLVYLDLGDTTRALNYWRIYLQSGYKSRKTRDIRAWYNQLLKKYRK